MKAIIEVSSKGSVFQTAAAQVEAARKGHVPDFHLSFQSARSLFAELTPARLDLLDTLPAEGIPAIFITAHPDHALRAFEVRAVDYLLSNW